MPNAILSLSSFNGSFDSAQVLSNPASQLLFSDLFTFPSPMPSSAYSNFGIWCGQRSGAIRIATRAKRQDLLLIQISTKEACGCSCSTKRLIQQRVDGSYSIEGARPGASRTDLSFATLPFSREDGLGWTFMTEGQDKGVIVSGVRSYL